MSRRSRDAGKAEQYRQEIYHLGRSFRFAFRGFRFAVGNERNMRIHLSVTLLVIEFALLYGLQPLEYAMLFMLFGMVIAAEMINTAIEALVDLQTDSYDHLARIAKDVAAGAVLILAVAAVLVAAVLFSDTAKLSAVFVFLFSHPLLIALLAAEFAVMLLFVFFWNSRTVRQLTKKKK